MTKHVAIRASACPHDCPSTCALEEEVLEDGRIGRVRGAADNSYTAGVICAKVARYAERAHHPDRLLHPLRRTGPKAGLKASSPPSPGTRRTGHHRRGTAEGRATHGAQSVWPYYYAGTMAM